MYIRLKPESDLLDNKVPAEIGTGFDIDPVAEAQLLFTHVMTMDKAVNAGNDMGRAVIKTAA